MKSEVKWLTGEKFLLGTAVTDLEGKKLGVIQNNPDLYQVLWDSGETETVHFSELVNKE